MAYYFVKRNEGLHISKKTAQFYSKQNHKIVKIYRKIDLEIIPKMKKEFCDLDIGRASYGLSKFGTETVYG